jgi:Ca-activated chloride channel family protein
MMHCAEPLRLFTLPIFVIIMVLIVHWALSLKKVQRLLCSQKHLKQLLTNFSLRKAYIKTALLLACLISLFIALLRPQWGEKENTVIQEGRDIVILLDVSRSMLAQDLKPNRLEFAKTKIKNVLESLSFERVGLIIFSANAYVQCPLTADHGALLMFLENVDAESISAGTTALDTALLKAIDVFNESKGRKNKLVLLLSDGEDFSQNLENAKKWIQDLGLSIFALGIGTPQGAPVPIIDASGAIKGSEVDAQGKPVLTRLNETLLASISKELGGSYMRAEYDDNDIASIKNYLHAFEKEKFDETKITSKEERYPLFLGFSFLCLLLEWIL